MKIVKRDILIMASVAFVLVVSGAFFVQKLTVKEFQQSENLKNKNQKEMSEATKQADKLSVVYSSEHHNLNESQPIEKQRQNHISDINPSSKPKNVIYEKPSSVIYLAQ